MTDLPWVSMALVGSGLLGVLGASEIAHRRLGLTAEQSRKLAHAGAGPIVVGLPAIFASAWPVLLLSLAFEVLLVVARLTGRLQSVHGIHRTSAGAFLYPVAISTTFLLAASQPERYAVAIAAMAFADAASGFVGERWGQLAYAAWGQAKSVEGSLAALAVTMLAAAAILVLTGTPSSSAVLIALFTGLLVALVEAALPWGLDNLGVPLAALVALDVAGSPVRAGLVLLAAVVLCRLATTRGRPLPAPTGPAAAETVTDDGA